MGSNQIETLETRTMMSVVPHAHPAPVKTVDPITTSSAITYKNFAGDPLFGDHGPSINDINQGDLGDCYLLSTLSSVAKTDPALIRKVIVADANGIYTVTFGSGTAAKKINVNADLPVWSDGEPAYARLGTDNSLWVALIEKAYVQYASPKTDKYASIEGGWMTSAFSALGLNSTGTYSVANATALLTTLQTDLAKGDFTTMGTVSKLPAQSPLVPWHAYEVNAVIDNAAGTPVSVTLRNPWGDGAANDGYITVTAAEAFAAFSGVVISHA